MKHIIYNNWDNYIQWWYVKDWIDERRSKHSQSIKAWIMQKTTNTRRTGLSAGKVVYSLEMLERAKSIITSHILPIISSVPEPSWKQSKPFEQICSKQCFPYCMQCFHEQNAMVMSWPFFVHILYSATKIFTFSVFSHSFLLYNLACSKACIKNLGLW